MQSHHDLLEVGQLARSTAPNAIPDELLGRAREPPEHFHGWPRPVAVTSARPRMPLGCPRRERLLCGREPFAATATDRRQFEVEDAGESGLVGQEAEVGPQSRA